MLKLILLGWVVGIAFMGIDIPLITQYGWIGKVLLFICLMFYIFKRHLVVNHPLLKGVYYLICGLSLFVIGHQYAQHALNERLQLREMQPESLDIIVYIDRISEEKDNKTQQLAQVLGRSSDVVNWLLYLKNENESALIEGPKLQLGHYYQISGKTRPAHSYAVSGAFDQEQWFIQRNIMSGFSVQHIEPLNSNEIYRLGYQSHLKQQQNFLTRQQLNIEKLRLKFRLMLKKSPFQNKGLLLALLTGDESLLNEDIKNQFKQLGISHLLAISGPHVLIFAILLSWGLHQLVRRYYPQLYLWQPKQIWAMIPLCFGVLIYTAFVGFEIPALRTLLSVFLFAFLLLVKLPVKPFSLLVYSASLLLLFDPFSVLSAGFWLSYGSCFILLRIYQTIVQVPNLASLSLLSRIILLAKTLIESQGKIFIALCPLMLIFFQQISWVAPLTNIIAVPLLGGVIVPLNIFAACVWLILNSLGNALFQINDILLSMVLTCFSLLEKLSLPLQGFSLTPLALIGLSCAIIILFLPRGVLPKSWSLICCLPLVIPNKTSQQIQLNIIDVGQGKYSRLYNMEFNLTVGF
ncbi:ComE operon protein 3 [Acinetobacter oleivorans]|nr:ComE operon protein 3 [Acinetobacter oleivorans]CAI3124841.1 ComE operon protein 3 [Acinetobacter oleivorans]CAI3124854.1 ComE operon protein 3 [Acinetobacter oleivorans]CAI3124863.1 ComE operon protein 3 [Acinetobacter oleivorans]CAI3124988.1 ComE operon protein 3 [Acinetobacter oleivorans]